MKNLFKEKEAQEYSKKYPAVPPELALRVYTSRLLGKDPYLVLHGGGNTSVKLKMKNIVGEEQDTLYVKGSGLDMASIDPWGFTGLKLAPLRKLKKLENLSAEEMENQLQVHKICFSSPDPSVEALLHAFLPCRYVDHTHADYILILTNLQNGEGFLKEALGPKVAIIPYAHPGIQLAKKVAGCYERNPEVEAIVVMNHGIFTFGEDARVSYERMIKYAGRAEDYLKKKTKKKKIWGGQSPKSFFPKNFSPSAARLTQVIRGACAHRREDGSLLRFYTELRSSPDLRKASLLEAAEELGKTGVLTPDHVIRTKNLWAHIDSIPDEDEALRRKVKKVVEDYQAIYDRSFGAQPQAQKGEWKKADSNPRVFLVGGIGLMALGFTRKEALIAADIAEHTLQAKLLANLLGKYEPIQEAHALAMEYWPLQRKKLGPPLPLPLQGQVAVITGAGGAIGLGIAERLLAAGAVVVISDVDENALQKVYSILVEKFDETLLEKIVLDVTDYESVVKAYQEISCRLGGIDILVPNAGVAHVAKIEDLHPQKFDKVMAVNLKGTFNTIKASIPIFRRQGTGGSVIVVSSKNVFDPGAAFGAYSASKAGAHQISKIAALELAELGVRVNLVNPDAVFGDEEVPSKLWELVGPERMKSRGLDPKGLKEYYRQRNLLKVQVTAEDVGNAVVFFASKASGATTGATLPVDGGIPAAFPR